MVPDPVPGGGRRRAEGERSLRGPRGRRGSGRRRAVAGDGIRRRPVAGRDGRGARVTAARSAGSAGGRAGGRPGHRPRRGRRARKPASGERPAGRGRAAGGRLRDLAGRRGERAGGRGLRLARVLVAGAGPGPGHRAGERHLQPGCGADFCEQWAGTVRFWDKRRADVPAGQQPGGRQRPARRAAGAGRGLPGQAAGEPAFGESPAGRVRWYSGASGRRWRVVADGRAGLAGASWGVRDGAGRGSGGIGGGRGGGGRGLGS
jgi:hypothetical protein